MIKSLTLGNRTFPVNLIQGPLAGISAAPFRRLTWEQGRPAFSCTEMISCKTLIYQTTHTHRRFVWKDPAEGPVCFQLSGHDPQELGLATRIVTDCGADLIDLNCGCPVKKIRSKGAGSRLLANPGELYHLIRAMKQNTTLPVSVKIRVDGHSTEKLNAEVARVVCEAGADFLVVHGRHWTDDYTTPCHYEDIQFFVENSAIPVIGNGDVSDAASLKRLFATGCAGVMISRAGVGQPWLMQKLIADLTGLPFKHPTSFEVEQFFRQHVRELAALLNSEKRALLEARQFVKYYAHHISHNPDFCAEWLASRK